ncbi:MAG: oligosaccharide flippase family protein, partial [Bacteroidetes bacterium]|nr:oligosaccharide flippase family protein [Bacteroidota bacterium]
MNTKNKVKKSLPYSIAISLLNLVISLFGMVYLVRYLDEVDFGMMGLFLGLPFLLNIGVAMGFDMYITRFLPSVKDDQEVARKFWRIFFVRMALISVISVGLIFVFPWFGPLFKMENHQVHFNFYQISLLATFGEIYTRVLMNARFMQKQLLIMRVVYQTIRLAIIFWGVSHQSDFLFFIIGFAGMDVLNLVIGVIIISAKIGVPKFSYIFQSYTETKDEKEYRQISYINQIGTSFLGTDIDRYIIGYFSTPTQVAIYVLATQILGKLGNFFPEKMLKPLSTPAFFAEYDNSKESAAKLNRMFQFIFNTNNIIGFMFLACFIPVGKDLIMYVFHKPYTEEAFWPLIIFMIFMVLYSIPIGMVTQAIKKPQIL